MLSFFVKSACLIFCISFNFRESNGCLYGTGNVFGIMPIKDSEYLVNVSKTFTCKLHKEEYTLDNITRRVNCSDMFVRFSNKRIASKCVDPLTLEFTIENATAKDSGMYFCFINAPQGKVYVCSASYDFGYEPLPVENFKCLSEDLYNLTCTWDPPANKVKTNYTLQANFYSMYFQSWDPNRILTCPLANRLANKKGCWFAFGGTPPYYTKSPQINFLLTGVNKFGNITQYFGIKHREIIRPGIPGDFKLKAVGTTFANLTFTNPPHMDPLIAPPLIFEIRYKNDFDDWVIKDLGVFEEGKNVNMSVSLEMIPYLNYTVALRCKVVENKDLWSDFTYLTVETKRDVPYYGPVINPRSFEIINYLNYRSITLYWQGIAEKHCNAPECGYEIHIFPTSVEKKRKKRNIDFKPYIKSVEGYNVTHFIASNLKLDVDYEFVIYTKNTLGRSLNSTTIRVAQKSKLLSIPNMVHVVSNESGYDVSWSLVNSDYSEPVSVTLAWCQNKKSRNIPCDGKINWLDFESNVTSHFLNIPEDGYVYQFAVAANSETSSSGLEWAPCVIPRNNRLDRIGYFVVNTVDSHTLNANWKFDCNAEGEIVNNYTIRYSHCDRKCHPNTESTYCQEPQYIFFPNTASLEYEIKNLEPFSYYRLEIAAHTSAGINEYSKPYCQRTNEAAPSDSPSKIKFKDVTSTSFSVTWRPPLLPNGLITKYKIFVYTTNQYQAEREESTQSLGYDFKNLTSYKNYTVRISACVRHLCTEKSVGQTVLTGTREPGIMNPPYATFPNSTTLLLRWDPPKMPNGPIDYYVLHIRPESVKDNLTLPMTYNVSGSHTNETIEWSCDEMDHAIPFMFTIQAVNLVHGIPLYGAPSEPTKETVCSPTLGGKVGPLTIGLTIGAVLGLGLFILTLYFLVKWMKRKVDTMKKFEVVLPNGLDSPHSRDMHSYENFKNGLKNNPDLSPKPAYGRLESFMSDDSFKNRHGSGTSQFSATSTDELIAKQNILTEKNKRNPSGDSSGGGSTGGHDSLSSSLTHRTNLSTDSGNEPDIKNPPSPEVARDGDSKETKYEDKQVDITCVTGSKDSGVDKGDDSDEKSKSPVSPYSQFSSCVDSSNKALGSYSPPTPYSKFGMDQSCYVPVSRGRHMTLYGHNLANSEPSINEMDEGSPYSQVGADSQMVGTVLDSLPAGQYSKFGLSRSIQDDIGWKNDYLDDRGTPKNVGRDNEEGAVLPYSRFGMRRVNPPIRKNNPYITVGMAFTMVDKDPKEILKQSKQPWLPEILTLNKEKTAPLSGKTKPVVSPLQSDENNLAYSKFGLDEENYKANKNTQGNVAPFISPLSKPGDGYVGYDDMKIMPISQMVANAERLSLEEPEAEDVDLNKTQDLGFETFRNSDVLSTGGIAPYSRFFTSSLKDDQDEMPEPFSLTFSDNIYPPPNYDELNSCVSPAKVKPSVNGYVSPHVLTKSSKLDSERTPPLSSFPPELEKPELKETKLTDVILKRSNGYITVGELPSVCGSSKETGGFNMPTTDV